MNASNQHAALRRRAVLLFLFAIASPSTSTEQHTPRGGKPSFPLCRFVIAERVQPIRASSLSDNRLLLFHCVIAELLQSSESGCRVMRQPSTLVPVQLEEKNATQKVSARGATRETFSAWGRRRRRRGGGVFAFSLRLCCTAPTGLIGRWATCAGLHARAEQSTMRCRSLRPSCTVSRKLNKIKIS